MRSRIRTWPLGLILLALAGTTVRPSGPARAAPETTYLGPAAGSPFGVDEPFSLRLPVAIPVAAVRRGLRTEQPVEVIGRQKDRYRIQPRNLWPADRRVRMVVNLRRIAPSWPWAHPSLQDTITTGADIQVSVSLTTQQMAVYDGEHLLQIMPVSTGAWPRYVTPTGHFYIFRRVRWDMMTGGTRGTADYYRVAHVPYAQYIFGGIAIHGAWWARSFGEPRSHGCIQLATKAENAHPQGVPEDAGWLWSVTRLGTPITITGTTPHFETRPIRYPASVGRSADPGAAAVSQSPATPDPQQQKRLPPERVESPAFG